MLILYSVFREHNASCKPHETGHTGFGTKIRAKNGKLNGSGSQKYCLLLRYNCGILNSESSTKRRKEKDGLRNL